MEKDRIWYLMGKKVTGEATPEELAELESLLQHKPDVRFTMEVMHNLWKPETDNDETAAEAAFHQQWAKLEATAMEIPEGAPAVRSRRRRIMAVCGILLLLAAGGWAWVGWQQHVREKRWNGEKEEIVTRNGSRSKVKLPDGTLVWLNGGSKLVYSHGTNNQDVRDVYLSGEAYFDVAPHAGQPFIIHAEQVQINVLGTVLNVRAYKEDLTTEATLISGRIAVKAAGADILLSPNQKFTLKKDQPSSTTAVTRDQGANNLLSYQVTTIKPMPVRDTAITAETSWVANVLIFQDESFDELAAKMERWYNKHIEFGNDRIKTYRFTGAFEDESLEDALKAMQLIHAFKFKFTTTGVYIY